MAQARRHGRVAGLADEVVGGGRGKVAGRETGLALALEVGEQPAGAGPPVALAQAVQVDGRHVQPGHGVAGQVGAPGVQRGRAGGVERRAQALGERTQTGGDLAGRLGRQRRPEGLGRQPQPVDGDQQPPRGRRRARGQEAVGLGVELAQVVAQAEVRGLQDRRAVTETARRRRLLRAPVRGSRRRRQPAGTTAGDGLDGRRRAVAPERPQVDLGERVPGPPGHGRAPRRHRGRLRLPGPGRDGRRGRHGAQDHRVRVQARAREPSARAPAAGCLLVRRRRPLGDGPCALRGRALHQQTVARPVVTGRVVLRQLARGVLGGHVAQVRGVRVGRREQVQQLGHVRDARRVLGRHPVAGGGEG